MNSRHSLDIHRKPAILMGYGVYMAKNDNNSTFGDFTKKVNLSPDRKNLKPRPQGLTEEQYLSIALQEGYALLEEDEKNSVKTPPSASKSDSVKLDNKLGEMSTNAYVRARIEVLGKMNPKTRATIEEMERIGNTCNPTYNKFVEAVTILGDKLSSSN